MFIHPVSTFGGRALQLLLNGGPHSQGLSS
uniref:Uncharacterized protein MANES_14G136900 n=1 Tax=Rhizophora mucronata TaxID=61149 RepID=A0A2P2MWR1_RHIMU